MRLFFSFLAILVLYDCKSKPALISKSKETEFRTYIEKNLQELDSAGKLDSFRFIRFDTITRAMVYYGKIKNLLDEVHRINNENELHLETYQSHMNLVRLSSDLDSDLYTNYKLEAEKDRRILDENSKKATEFLQNIDSLQKIRAKADSIQPVAYYGVCFYQLRKADQSVRKDTFFLILNQDKNIVEKEEILKSVK